MHYDLLVIGGGPAGYVGAIRAAQLGKKVACVEMDRAGGTCLNWGCIPTKSLLKNAELYHTMAHRAADYGMKIEKLTFDWEKIIGRSRTVSGKLAGGIEFLFKKNKIDYLRGEGTFKDGKTVVVKATDGTTQEHTADKFLIATGTVSRQLPGFPFDGKTVIDSKAAHDAAQAAEEHHHPRRRRHRRGVRLFLQRLRHQGHAHRNAAAHAAGRGRGSQRAARAQFQQGGHPGADRHQGDRAKAHQAGRAGHARRQGRQARRIARGRGAARRHRRRARAARRTQARARPRLHQDRRALPDQRAERLRGRRHHRAALARARRQLRGRAMRRGHLRRTQAEESRRPSPAAPTASRRSRASDSPSARRRRRDSSTRSANSRFPPAARRSRSATARAS